MRALDVPPVAAAQDGLFTRGQAREAGWSRDRIRRRLDAGLWRPVVGQVLTATATTLTVERRCRAAAMATAGVVSHQSAAVLWSLPPCAQASDGPVHVTVDALRNPRLSGVRIHRTPLCPDDRTVASGIALTTRRRTLVDCLGSLRYPRALELLEHMLVHRWLSTDELAAEVARACGRHGVRQLRCLLEESRHGSRSEAERLMRGLLRDAGIQGWRANVRMEPVPGTVAIVDLWFPRPRVAVEVDGRAWHISPDRFQRDRTRQNALVLAGAVVLRFTWEDLVRRPAQVVAEINAAVREPTDRYARVPARTGP